MKYSINEFVANNQMLTPHQHGFCKGKSCLTNLLESLDEWTGAVDRGSGVSVIFLDFKKAFDSVPHHRMMKKLGGYGICGNLLKWLSNFIQHRLQRVVINGTCSDWISVKSGVPQGSVLGPLLFLLYVNDIPDSISCSLKLFADDVKIYMTTQSPSDVVHLQYNLDLLNNWSLKWQLYLNISKCKFLSLGNSLNTAYTIIDPVNGERVQLSQCSEEKDLGIWYTSDLKPSTQCRKAVAKAMQALGLIKRSFKYISNESFPVLYKLYVRPALEYCVPAWSPYLLKDIDLME